MLTKTDGILNDKMDKLMEKFKKTNADFYRLYFNGRIVVDLGSRKQVKEKSVEKPVAGSGEVGVAADVKVVEKVSPPDESGG